MAQQVSPLLRAFETAVKEHPDLKGTVEGEFRKQVHKVDRICQMQIEGINLFIERYRADVLSASRREQDELKVALLEQKEDLLQVNQLLVVSAAMGSSLDEMMGLSVGMLFGGEKPTERQLQGMERNQALIEKMTDDHSLQPEIDLIEGDEKVESSIQIKQLADQCIANIDGLCQDIDVQRKWRWPCVIL